MAANLVAQPCGKTNSNSIRATERSRGNQGFRSDPPSGAARARRRVAKLRPPMRLNAGAAPRFQADGPALSFVGRIALAKNFGEAALYRLSNLFFFLGDSDRHEPRPNLPRDSGGRDRRSVMATAAFSFWFAALTPLRPASCRSDTPGWRR